MSAIEGHKRKLTDAMNTELSADDKDFQRLPWGLRALGLTGKKHVVCCNSNCRQWRKKAYSRYDFCPYCGSELESGFTHEERKIVEAAEEECLRKKMEAMIAEWQASRCGDTA